MANRRLQRLRRLRRLWRLSRPVPRFATQALLAQAAVLLLITGAGFGLVALLLRGELRTQYEQRALAVARAVAADPAIVGAVTAHRLDPQVQQRAEAVRVRTGVLFVVVADDRAIRYSHPDPARIGERVSTDPAALRGREVVTFERGTLGLSARGKVPLKAAGGRVVGQASVGISAAEVSQRVDALVGAAAGFSGAALLVGLVAAVLRPHRHRRDVPPARRRPVSVRCAACPGP
jgi:two-component system CitB family sensor kinase